MWAREIDDDGWWRSEDKEQFGTFRPSPSLTGQCRSEAVSTFSALSHCTIEEQEEVGSHPEGQEFEHCYQHASSVTSH